MTRHGKRSSPSRSSWPGRLEQAALLIVLSVVCARGTIQEQPDYEQLHVVSRLQGTAGQVGGCGPAVSLVLDGLILAAVAMCTVAAAIRGRWRDGIGGVGLTLILMVVATALSLPAASNLRLALNGSIGRIAAVLVLLTVAQTVRRWWQVRLVLAGVAATGVTFAVFCIAQVYEQADTRQWLREHKDEAIRSGRISPDDPMIRLLEARAATGEVSGFFAHSNIAASYLMTCGLGAVALGVARLRAARRTFRVLFGLVALAAGGLMAVGLVLTQGRGPIVAGAVCAVGWAVAAMVWWRWEQPRAWVVRHWRALLTAGWMAVLLLGVATVAVGLRHGGLPGASLTFRWHYWTGAAYVVAGHPLTGVGAGNFDRHYVRYKPVEVPEEVKNPHNYLVTMATEWGIMGLAAAIVLWVAVSIALCRPTPRPLRSDDGSDDDDGPSSGGGLVALWSVLLVTAVLAARTVGTPPQLWLIWALVPGVIWVMAFLALGLDSDQPRRFEDDPLKVTGGLVAALLAVALHNMISFSIVYPGSACTFFALAGLALAVRRMTLARPSAEAPAEPAGSRDTDARRRQPRTMFLATGVVAASVMYWPVMVTPVTAATRWLTRARATPIAAETLEFYHQAVQADPLDPVAPEELARWATRSSQQGVSPGQQLGEVAVVNARTAVERDPEDNRHYRTLASACAARYAERGDPNDADRAAEAAARAVELYPKLPRLRVDYGEVLVLQATVRRDPALLERGVAQMRLALRLDDARWPGEIRRFTAAHRAQIRARVHELEGGLGPTTRSATQPTGRGAPAPASRTARPVTRPGHE